MSWSFAIKNGDLNPYGPGGYQTVTGSQKLLQDLRVWLLTPRGSDPLHLDYGSTLDGGTVDGATVESSIGSIIDPTRLLALESEVRRVLYAYQQQQMDRLYADQQQLGGKNTFSVGEILYDVENVQLSQIGDVVVIAVSIRASDGTLLNVTTPVGA
jgi:phage baseplate assembly protein W